MALKTTCQTPGTQFHTIIEENLVTIQVDLPKGILPSGEEENALLEANLHNALELVLAPYFRKQPRSTKAL